MGLKGLLRLWRVEDPQPATADVIAVPSMSAVVGRLSSGTRAFFLKALEVKKSYPEATIVYVTFDPTEVGEAEWKKQMAPDAVFAGKPLTSVGEACLTKAVLPAEPRSIILVTGECHSRRAKLIWEKVFPKSKISVVTVPAEKEVDRESILLLLRRVGTCLAANIAGWLVLKFFGLGIASKARQPKA